MSEPRHVWMTPTGHTGVYIEVTPDYPGAMRRTLTEGPEWTALMERARATLPSGGAHTFADVMQLLMDRGDILRDLIAYLGEKP